MTIVDKPDAGRTAIVVGRVGVARRAPDYAAGVVATAVLSGYSGRLNQEVRVKRGLSYGAGAQLIARREPGLFLASTLVDHTKVGEAVAVILDTLRGLATTAPEPAELVTRKATISGGFSRSVETIDGITGVLGELALYDVPLTELGEYLPEIEAVDPAQVRQLRSADVRRSVRRAGRRRAPFRRGDRSSVSQRHDDSVRATRSRPARRPEER